MLFVKKMFALSSAGVMYHQIHSCKQEPRLQNREALNRFFASTERRAFRMAVLATGDDDVALDIVQDAMLALSSRYANRDEQQWGALFHRILQSKIRDWYRRHSVRSRIMSWLRGDDNAPDAIQLVKDETGQSPEQYVSQQSTMRSTLQAISQLPLRQQQCFLLRAWQGYSVRDTANIMACSEGSVKTHYSRAIKALRSELRD